MSIDVVVNNFVRMVVENIKRFPVVMRTAKFFERRWPRLWAKLMVLVAPVSNEQFTHQSKTIYYDDLSLRARQIYADLKVENERKKEHN